jgi:hypothetical protein
MISLIWICDYSGAHGEVRTQIQAVGCRGKEGVRPASIAEFFILSTEATYGTFVYAIIR